MWEYLFGAVLAVVCAALLFWRFWFLRQPRRTIPKNGIVSPASGKIIRIIRYRNGLAKDIPKGMLGRVRAVTHDVAREGCIIVIMLSPLDVHFQRSPAAGTVLKTTYTKGVFKNAVIGASYRAFENEQNSVLLKTAQGKMKVIQVAGIAARRISCFVRAGERVRKGDVIGLINLGSQTILVLPKKRLLAQEGDAVVDGETVIA
jgi:phosphatidylserine decarboxylase